MQSKRAIGAVVIAAGLAASVSAQCGPGWLKGNGSGGMGGGANRQVLWDPDGAGPRGPIVVFCGSFSTADERVVHGVATWDPATGAWGSLESPGFLGGSDLCVTPAGDLVMVASFSASYPSLYIVRWNGTAWTPISPDIGAPAWDLLPLPDGSFVLCGDAFTIPGVTGRRAVMRCENGQFVEMGGVYGSARAAAIGPDGEVVVAGSLTDTNGGRQFARVQAWYGSGWSLIQSFNEGTINSIAYQGSDLLIAGTQLRNQEPAYASVLIGWEGSYRRLDNFDLSASIEHVQGLPDGRILATGKIGPSFTGVAEWSEAGGWRTLGATVRGNTGATYAERAMPMADGSLVMCGYFERVGDAVTPGAARWNGTAWETIGAGTAGNVYDIVPLASGGMLAVGNFTGVQGVSVDGVGVWNGAEWSPLGRLSLSSADNAAYAAAIDAAGTVYVGGLFTYADGRQTPNIARWSATGWQPMGMGLSGQVNTLLAHPSGDLYAGGMFSGSGGQLLARIARWDGHAWQPLGTGLLGQSTVGVTSMVLMPSGDLVVGGSFSSASGGPVSNIARWNGQAWSAIGSGLNGPVRALGVDPQGRIVAGGTFTAAGAVATPAGIARWDGAQWTSLASSMDGTGFPKTVYTINFDQNGDLIVGGNFYAIDGVRIYNLARRRGNTWEPITPGSIRSAYQPEVRSIEYLSDGELAIGGVFSIVNGVVTPGYARYSATGAPTIASGPEDASVAGGQTVELVAIPYSGFSGVSYQWRRDGGAVVDGPHGASPAGGEVTGAAGVLDPHGQVLTLRITGAGASDAGRYTLELTNACGTASAEASLTVASCPADINGDGFLDFFDYDDFVACFEGTNCFSQNPLAADFNGDGFIDFFDYDDFVAVFEAGC